MSIAYSIKNLRSKFIIGLFCLLSVDNCYADTCFLYFNDFHGRVESVKNQETGAAKLISSIEKYKQNNKRCKDTVILSGGDNYQGSAVSFFSNR